MSQIADKFLAAVTALAGEASIKARLISAYSECLSSVRSDELPGGLRKEFESLQGAMCTVDPQPNESKVTASVRKMSGREATQHARNIVAMFTAIIDTGKQAEIAAKVARGDAEETAEYPGRSIRLQ